ncbi:MAG: fatty acid desaturase [Marinovum sp.]|nr:fatty acid desaturase [Marinovum sp.]
MARDYSLLGEEGARAVEAGLAKPTWYRTKIDPRTIRELMIKEDARPLRDLAIWLGALIVTATCAVLLWPSWWSAPFWIAYGVLYCSASDARWHECGHRTAFKTQWLNEAVYHLASFFLLRSPIVWRASHVRHHTDTIIVGRDPEIQLMRPPKLAKLLINVLGISDVIALVPRFLGHVMGHLHSEEKAYVRDADALKVFLVARIWAVIYVSVLLTALVAQSWLPLILVGFPRIYGAWHMWMTGVLQHLGLAENVTDHRLNTRTVLMNPVSRFLYLNMNYHVEHHMFTMVPYYHLPKLHALIAYDLPPPEPSIPAAFRRLVPVILRQLREEQTVIVPDLPPTAAPYRDEVQQLLAYAAPAQ